jgi:Ca2+-dependent lipid-binding protein
MTTRCTVSVTVLQGTGLVAKDRNLLGRKTSSDPYVECISTFQRLGDKNVFGNQVGRTATLPKTLEPVFNHTFADFDFAYCESPVIQLRIFDEDKFSEPDAMGTVKIPISMSTDSDTTQWYTVPKDSAKNASGKLQVRIHIKVHRLQQYVTNTASSHTSKKSPKKFIIVDGVNKLNPKYLAWKKKQKA